MVFVRAKIASVIFSGAGPPAPMLYLTPKSPSGPPGLWLAERMIPPKAPRCADKGGGRRRRQDPALADHDAAEPVGGGHFGDNLDRLAVEETPVAADDQRLALIALERIEDRLDEIFQVVGAWKTGTFLRKPDVPGFWSGNGLVATERIILAFSCGTSSPLYWSPMATVEPTAQAAAENFSLFALPVDAGAGLWRS